VLLSTLLSLFVVPAFYLLLAKYTHAPEERARALEKMAAAVPSVDEK
jgi:multidrug efflux pump